MAATDEATVVPEVASDAPPPDVDEVSAWCGEPLLLEGEPVSALAPGRWRHDALEMARVERALGAPGPSAAWRARYALALGLQRLDARDPIALLDGTILAEHQAEVVEATLAAIVEQLETPAPADPADPGRARRMSFEHATGSGKSVTGIALCEAARTCGVLFLVHTNVLVEQFRRELASRGYGARLRRGNQIDPADRAPIVVETYSWLVQNYDLLEGDQFALVLCDEAHKSLGPQTSEAIRTLEQSTVIAMTATSRLIDKDISGLYPRKVSRFDLRTASRLGVISPLRCLRVQPAVSIDTLQGVRSRGGDLDAEQLESLLNVDLLNRGAARFYRDTFGDLPGVVYAAGVAHAERVAAELVAVGVGAAAVSGQTPRLELARVLDDFEAGRLRVIVNAMLLTEGWNSPRVTVCMHLAPTASPRVYQQRVGRVTRRAPGKEAGIVVDFVPSGYRADGRIVTLHSLVGEAAYSPGALVTRGRDSDAQRAKVAWPEEGRVWPVSDLAGEREQAMADALWRIPVAQLDVADQEMWARQAGLRCSHPQELRKAAAALKAADEDAARHGWRGDPLVVTLGRNALHSQSEEVRRAAIDLLDTALDPRAAAAVVDRALDVELDAAQARSLAHRALVIATRTRVRHGDLLALARLEGPLYERAALSDPDYRRIRDMGAAKRTPETPARVGRYARAAHADAAAAGALAACPVDWPGADRLLAQTAEARWPDAQQFAAALLAARGARIPAVAR